jgi:hypothetical protein
MNQEWILPKTIIHIRLSNIFDPPSPTPNLSMWPYDLHGDLAQHSHKKYIHFKNTNNQTGAVRPPRSRTGHHRYLPGRVGVSCLRLRPFEESSLTPHSPFPLHRYQLRKQDDRRGQQINHTSSRRTAHLKSYKF